MKPGHRLAVCLTALLIVLSTAALADAELSQKGDLFVHFDGGISPRALPRAALAPIAVRIEGTVKTPSGERPPSLSRIRIALNRGGKLDSRGLPVCRRSQIESSSGSQALAICEPALVGTGGIVAKTAFPGQAAYVLRGNVLLFNSVEHGHPTILAHIYQSVPSPITNVITFKIRRTGGTFGTVIVAEMPPALENNGYLKSIFLRLQRSYVFHGKKRAYLSASCSALPGSSRAVFPFAKASMSFDDGRVLSSTLIRTCKTTR
jgi:hypothetical protein